MPHPPRTVWQALVDPVKLAAWFMPNDFAPVVGHRFTFHRKANPVVRFSDTIACQVLELREHELLSYSWTDGGEYAGDLDSTVTWTLRPEGRGTRLFLQHRGFRPDDPAHQAARGLMTGGWRIYLTDRLPAFLSDSDQPTVETQRGAER
nr:SRPBCC domain-containing protein [Pseudonocardia acidicola]